MRSISAFIGAASVLVGAMLCTATASASLSPAHIVGRWSAGEGCSGGRFAYVKDGSQLLQELRADGRVYRTPVTVKVEGDLIRVRFDEKVFTFRLPTRDTLQAVGYTDTRNGLTMRIATRIWHRCS